MKPALELRAIRLSDCQAIHEAFKEQGWNKSAAKYENYVEFQESGVRDVIIATVDGAFAGYLTIMWASNYPPFREKDIPEVVDFNVLKKYQRQGIGAQLMDEAERRIKKVAAVAGIGFGVYTDYGPAQILYINRGYKPDGRGLIKDYFPVPKGTEVRVDDSLVIYLTKSL